MNKNKRKDLWACTGKASFISPAYIRATIVCLPTFYTNICRISIRISSRKKPNKQKLYTQWRKRTFFAGHFGKTSLKGMIWPILQAKSAYT